jgi:hypothetical protein
MNRANEGRGAGKNGQHAAAGGCGEPLGEFLDAAGESVLDRSLSSNEKHPHLVSAAVTASAHGEKVWI